MTAETAATPVSSWRGGWARWGLFCKSKETDDDIRSSMKTSNQALDYVARVVAPMIIMSTTALVIVLDAPYAVAAWGVIVLLATFAWNRFNPLWPFLALVAAIQGGILLQLPPAAGSLQTALPLLGALVLTSLFINGNLVPRADRVRLNHARFPLPLMIFLVTVLVTDLARAWTSESFASAMQGSLTYVQLAALTFVAVLLLTDPRRVTLMAYAIIASGVVAAVMTLAAQLGPGPSAAEIVDRGYTRAVGALTDPNFFSFQLLVPFAFAFYMSITAVSRVERVALVLASAALVAAVVSTYSAGAIVGLTAAVAATLVLQLRVSISRALTAFVAICLVTAIVAAAAPPQYLDTVNAKYAAITNTTPEEWGTGRGAAWIAALRTFESNPLLGVGTPTENIQIAIAEHFDFAPVTRKAAHNMYLSTAVGMGAIGLAAFTVLLISSLATLWSRFSDFSRAHSAEAARAIGCLLPPLVVVMVQGLQLDLHLEKYLWLLIGATIAIREWRNPADAGSAD